jgi:hypothetical protein
MAGSCKSPGWAQIRGRPAECRCPPLQHQARLWRYGNEHNEKCLVNVHARPWSVSADTPVRDQGPGGSLPGPDAGHPLQGADGHGRSIHDPEYARNGLGRRGDK